MSDQLYRSASGARTEVIVLPAKQAKSKATRASAVKVHHVCWQTRSLQNFEVDRFMVLFDLMSPKHSDATYGCSIKGKENINSIQYDMLLLAAVWYATAAVNQQTSHPLFLHYCSFQRKTVESRSYNRLLCSSSTRDGVEPIGQQQQAHVCPQAEGVVS
jgi:hypothetical protein